MNYFYFKEENNQGQKEKRKDNLDDESTIKEERKSVIFVLQFRTKVKTSSENSIK